MLGINLNIPRKSCLRTQEFLTLISLKTLLDKYKQHLHLWVEYMLSRHVYSPNKAVNLPPAQLLRLPKLICSHTFPFAPCVPIRSIHAISYVAHIQFHLHDGSQRVLLDQLVLTLFLYYIFTGWTKHNICLGFNV